MLTHRAFNPRRSEASEASKERTGLGEADHHNTMKGSAWGIWPGVCRPSPREAVLAWHRLIKQVRKGEPYTLTRTGMWRAWPSARALGATSMQPNGFLLARFHPRAEMGTGDTGRPTLHLPSAKLGVYRNKTHSSDWASLLNLGFRPKPFFLAKNRAGSRLQLQGQNLAAQHLPSQHPGASIT